MNTLVSFEAAARHLSFKRAAEELFVTPSAVSHQIKALEDELNVSLFIRKNKNIELSPVGVEYYSEIHPAIAAIRQATSNLKSKNRFSKLTLHTLPYLTEHFLAHKINELKSMLTDVEITIESSTNQAYLLNSNPDELHLALRFTKDKELNLQYDKLTQVMVTPICSKSNPIKNTKLNVTSDPYSWKKWQQDWQFDFDLQDNLHCDSYAAVLNMAERGTGIAMGYFPFVSPEVENGKLEQIHPDKLSDLGTLYLVYPQSSMRYAEQIKQVKLWLKHALNLT